jgi:hypothetical protein
MPLRLMLALSCLVMLEGGCAPHEMNVTELGHGPLAFLADGVTTREQVLLKLGHPSAQFEGQRILTYRVRQSGPNDVQVSEHRHELDPLNSHALASHSVVLVFDTRNVLVRHAIVPME